MGCDIHLGVEKRINGKWERVNPPDDYPRDDWDKEQFAEAAPGTPHSRWYKARMAEKWYGDRNYEAFAILADVRNSYGITPIAEPRGWPADMSDGLKERIEFVPEKENEWWLWFGDHTESWLTVRELAEYDWLGQSVEMHGLVDWKEFEAWTDAGADKSPRSYCQGVSSRTKVIGKDEATRKLKAMRSEGLELPTGHDFYVRVSWNVNYAEAAGRLHSLLLPALIKLAGDDLDSVRIVFNFDS